MRKRDLKAQLVRVQSDARSHAAAAEHHRHRNLELEKQIALLIDQAGRRLDAQMAHIEDLQAQVRLLAQTVFADVKPAKEGSARHGRLPRRTYRRRG